MALSTIEHLILQARSMPQDEIDKLCNVAFDTFHQSDKSADCSFALRQLVFILQASTTEPSLPKKLIGLMLQSLGSGRSGVSKRKQCVLCSDLLREVLPSDELSLQDGQAPLTPNKSVEYLPLYIIQGHAEGCLDKIVPFALRWLTEEKLDCDVQKKLFTFLVGVETLHRHMLSEVDVTSISKKASDWLMNASLYQAPNPYTYNPFKKDHSLPVNEIDGTPSRNFFSVLNVGQYYTEDQVLNIFTFSLLYKWLSHPNTGKQQSRTVTPTGETTHTSTIFTTLVPKTVDYCFRILDQCERKPKVPQDCDLQDACLLEVVKILDLVCKIDHGQLSKVFQEIKRLFSRLTQKDTPPRILLQILQFFLNHSEEVVYDPQQAYDMYFGHLISLHCGNASVAYETLQFITDNLETLCYKTNVLSKYFPNIFKVFHALLDLPCICAALEVSERALKGESTPAQTPAQGGELTSLEAYRDPLYNLMFKFVMRVEGGCGDTISRLKDLHDILHDMCNSPRVVVCGQVVPVLLRVFFTVIGEEGDEKLANQMFPVILERTGLLYEIPEYQIDVRRLLAESVYQLFRAYPSLVVDQYTEIMEYIMSTRNITHKERLFSHLVWGIGEYCSNSHDKRCTPEMICKYYEALEALTYEISGMVQSAPSEELSSFSPRLVTILLSALAKLATRCQDLIPRVILCLTKVSQQQLNSNLEPETKESLVDRAQELINLLKLPNFASVILNPSADIESGSSHKDHTSEAVILRTTHRILRPDL
ncbi:AP-5 complex subunit zeta-1-like isoform X2 [Liolophura sinensis]|uniref:AP-5 complex subunit zeta-1-like isoform X2 n=1 Tax=Liolophura sinensis TaxID=3198878 RepID=UPI0031585DA1